MALPKHAPFGSALSHTMHELVQPLFKSAATALAKSGGYLESYQLMLLYIWAVAIVTTVFGEAGQLDEDEADVHISQEAEFFIGTLLPQTIPAIADKLDLGGAELDEEDFFTAYQSILLFLAYRVEEESDAEEVVEEFFQTTHDMDAYEHPDQITIPRFANVLLDLFVDAGEAAVNAAENNHGVN